MKRIGVISLDITNSTTMTLDRSLIISPINKKTSGADYNGQVTAYETGRPMRWDDSYRNLAKIGDYFAFTFHKSKVLFYTIVDVQAATKRPEEWDDQNHKSRRVVVLSNAMHEMDWDTWLSMDGHKRPNGTTHLRDGLKTSTKIITLLNIIQSRKAARERLERERLEKSMALLINSTHKRTKDLDAKWTNSLLNMNVNMTIVVSSDDADYTAPLRIIDLQLPAVR